MFRRQQFQNLIDIVTTKTEISLTPEVSRNGSKHSVEYYCKVIP